MATIRSYTTIEQSKVLAKILPLESADMRYHTISHYNPYPCDEIVYTIDFGRVSDKDVPCWSLAALLSVLPERITLNNEKYYLNYKKDKVEYLGPITKDGQKCITSEANNLVDACYEMILMLHELKML